MLSRKILTENVAQASAAQASGTDGRKVLHPRRLVALGTKEPRRKPAKRENKEVPYNFPSIMRLEDRTKKGWAMNEVSEDMVSEGGK